MISHDSIHTHRGSQVTKWGEVTYVIIARIDVITSKEHNIWKRGIRTFHNFLHECFPLVGSHVQIGEDSNFERLFHRQTQLKSIHHEDSWLDEGSIRYDEKSEETDETNESNNQSLMEPVCTLDATCDFVVTWMSLYPYETSNGTTECRAHQ